jgi:HEAT repeat protein
MTGMCLALLLALQQSADDDCKKALEDFRAAYRSAGEQARIVAVEKLGQHKCESAVGVLALILTGEAESVRIATAKTLGAFDDPKAVEAVAQAVAPNIKNHEVLEALTKALVELDWEVGATTLNPLLSKHDDKDILEALHVIVPMLGKLGSATSVEPLIKLLEHAENEKGGLRRRKGNTRLAALEGPIRKALEEITGGTETTWRVWRDWWNQNRERLQAGATLVYRCQATGKRWAQKAGESVKCPNHDKPVKDAVLVSTRLAERKKP